MTQQAAVELEPAGAPLPDAAAITRVPAFSRLVRTEFRRLAARRFARVLLALSAIGYLVAVGFMWHSHARVTPGDIAQATAQRDQQIAEIRRSVNDCLSQSTNQADRLSCGDVPTPEQFGYDLYLHNHPFEPGQVFDYALAVGVGTAIVGFVLGATFIGAEWSSKNLVAWLFWEPRRLRLMVAKLLALLGSVLVLAVLAQIAWFVTAHLLLHFRGSAVSTLGLQSAHFWSHVVDAQVRSALLVLVTAAMGFALASLLRNTAAAFGIAFVYFAVVETVLRAINPDLQPYLFTTGLTAWASNAGITVEGRPEYQQEFQSIQPKEIFVSNSHGGLVLLLFALVLVIAALTSFRRRDIS